MATTMCEIDGRRPAVATVRIRQDGEERTIAVCEEHLRELQGQTREAGRSPFGGGSLFDEFFSDFFGDSGLGSRMPGAAGGTTTTRPRRPSEQIDVRSTSATRRANCSSAPRRKRWSGGAWTSTRHTCSGLRPRTRSSGTCCGRSGRPCRDRGADRGGSRHRGAHGRCAVTVAGREGCALGRLRGVASDRRVVRGA